ncbi:hypothetical protein KEM60_01723 [Austwickia sp. TVS 96-490-7B]|uniref:DUF3349 domain-containing protein n=1 Tax=Austwickia sp. TVS 96-490-7B TaxID=2830843 RepID=UPI001C586CD6|nr:DUF3349 domain-containing protein [Austwickia sp. TVS 96-490-7B]MBW3085523.1 hypothetical protein [Austwickia sp. TVS 96-490-7B]
MGPLDRFITWVRAGYPHGVPSQDYIPLMALLRRRLSDDEVEDLGQELVRNGMIPADRYDVGAGIMKRTDEVPSPEEMHRVGSRLRDGGWPVSPQ